MKNFNNNLKKYEFNMKPIKLFDSFAGIGALHQALKELGYTEEEITKIKDEHINLNDEIIVTVIATGFEDEQKKQAQQQRRTYPQPDVIETLEEEPETNDDDDSDFFSSLRKRGF